MKNKKRLLSALAISLVLIPLLSGCNIATVTTTNSRSSSSDSKDWTIIEKNFDEGNISEATSSQYRIVASNGDNNSYVHLHADENNNLFLSCEEDTVMVVLAKCKICGETTSFKKAALEKEQLGKFNCSCEGSSLLLHFYGITN